MPRWPLQVPVQTRQVRTPLPATPPERQIESTSPFLRQTIGFQDHSSPAVNLYCPNRTILCFVVLGKLRLRRCNLISPSMQRNRRRPPREYSREPRRQINRGLQLAVCRYVMSSDLAQRMRISDVQRSQRAHVRSNAHGLEAWLCRLNSRDDSEQIVGGMLAPRMRVRPRFARALRPRAEAKR